MARKVETRKVEANEAVHKAQDFVVAQLEDARKRLTALEKDLVKRGRAQQKEIEALLKAVRSGKPVKALEKQAEAAGTEVKKRLDVLQTQVLGALGVASRQEITQISRELTRLAKKVDALVNKKTTAPQLQG